MKQDSAKKLWIISGSSGVGKGTVLKAVLAKRPDLKVSISCTTRKKREGEVHGVNYFYITDEEFKQSIENDEFLEWAEFSGHYYGTKKAFVEECLANDEHVILEIETQGALKVKTKMPEAVMIFIVPPSYEELESRLRGRKTETEEAIKKRLEFVQFEQENSKQYDYIVVNDVVQRAADQILELIGD